EFARPSSQVRDSPCLSIVKYGSCLPVGRDSGNGTLKIDVVCVGVALSGDEPVTKSADGADDCYIPATSGRVGTEGDSGGICLDHALDQHGGSLRCRWKTTLPAVDQNAL